MFKITNTEKVDNLQEKLKNEFGDKIKLKKPIMPKIKIVSIPLQFDTSIKDNIVPQIINQNNALVKAFGENKDSLQFIFARETKGNKSLVLKCSPEIRSILKQQNDRINISHFQCKVYDRIHVVQCSKCCKFGHTKQNCNNPDIICTFCSDKHIFQACPHKQNITKHACHNCLQICEDKTDFQFYNHNAFSEKCPLLLKEKFLEQILASPLTHILYDKNKA